ncbi:hypothetical protein HK097_000181 [Rhizophlyctis rosea]|uniref:NADP-dependent oxidoreductase domain-containing protein n=1 Tax=Rhizophlyctis rosea TaxID=64517 RepID=A0AAD5S7P4_9FUNG|nr:hypothetical protein HK097_000181 [Rhizophlyctis rosea]
MDFQAGYRHIDTAEEQVGAAIRASNVPRFEIFVTTKVRNPDQGYGNTLRAFQTSLEKLGLEYIDLYLIHAPVKATRAETWRALEKLKEDGKVRAIDIHHLVELQKYATILPEINQLEITPYLQRREVVKYCQENNIVVEAYSPLTQGHKLKDPPLPAIAQSLNKSPAQVLI